MTYVHMHEIWEQLILCCCISLYSAKQGKEKENNINSSKTLLHTMVGILNINNINNFPIYNNLFQAIASKVCTIGVLIKS